MKDFSFPKEQCVFQTYGMMSHYFFRFKKPDYLCKVYEPRTDCLCVLCILCSLRISPDFVVLQGADADDFNPDRFIDADGQVTPAMADTKDGTSVIKREIYLFIDSLAFRLQKVTVSLCLV